MSETEVEAWHDGQRFEHRALCLVSPIGGIERAVVPVRTKEGLVCKYRSQWSEPIVTVKAAEPVDAGRAIEREIVPSHPNCLRSLGLQEASIDEYRVVAWHASTSRKAVK